MIFNASEPDMRDSPWTLEGRGSPEEELITDSEEA